MQIDFVYSSDRPDQCADLMWELQVKLDSCAQQLFGKRNPNKSLLRPVFVADGPHVRNTLSLDGGFAELSPTLLATGLQRSMNWHMKQSTCLTLDQVIPMVKGLPGLKRD